MPRLRMRWYQVKAFFKKRRDLYFVDLQPNLDVVIAEKQRNRIRKKVRIPSKFCSQKNLEVPTTILKLLEDEFGVTPEMILTDTNPHS